ncbi:hypothetical protein C8F04DRAFT_389051 [Mycena alexandri]|uniref:Uncharacterized protein n=1 Tax=Mycena alexandri TaxID=1745969 RepID=A0AAD6T253_9AGAR|nr:hypothetical protein C8F04DRAFT_389051 [Mycena alexandri]
MALPLSMPMYPSLHLPMYPSFPHVFHFPTPSATPFGESGVSISPASLSSAALDAVLIIAIALALLGTSAIVWVCHRRRTRVLRITRESEQDEGESRPNLMMQETHIIPNTWDNSHAFWVKRTMPSTDLITSAEVKMNEALLSEVPNVWRILGRPNVATTEDSDSDYREAIPEIRKTSD